MRAHTKAAFQALIEEHLLTDDYVSRPSMDCDPELALIPDVLLEHTSRVKLHVSSGSKETNKSYHDQLFTCRSEVEGGVSSTIDWQRLDDKNTCRVCTAIERGGWADRTSWPEAIPPTVDAMVRLEDALDLVIAALEQP